MEMDIWELKETRVFMEMKGKMKLKGKEVAKKVCYSNIYYIKYIS